MKIKEHNRLIEDVRFQNYSPDGLSFCEDSHTERLMWTERLLDRDFFIYNGRLERRKTLSVDACTKNMNMR